MQISEVSHTVLLFKLNQIILKKKKKNPYILQCKTTTKYCVVLLLSSLEARRSFLWAQHDVANLLFLWAMSLFNAAVSFVPTAALPAAARQLQARHEELRLKHEVPPDEPPTSWPILLLDIGKGPATSWGHWDTHWRGWVQGSWDEEALGGDKGRSGTQHECSSSDLCLAH